jgi:multiple sugar transport system ATP-binding protein
MAELRLETVSKKFGNTQAISGLDLTIADGEFVVLLGPTGAGKTTTLRLAAGLDSPDEGRVFLGGRDVTQVNPANRDVTFVFQQYSLYPHLSVFDNMAFPLKAPGRKSSAADINKRVREIADMLQIGHKLKNKATELSGGEMQRVSIGRALVRSPSIFLMDEPLSSLDAKLREDLRLELKRIQRDIGATILYVTHDQLEAMTLADRIGILKDGVLTQVGPPREVYERPSSIYSAKRLGSPQINLLKPMQLGIAPRHSKTATIGLRPEDVIIEKSATPNAKVLAVENLGVETVILLDVDGTHVHGLLDRRVNLKLNDAVLVSAIANKFAEFDQAGQAIDPRG